DRLDPAGATARARTAESDRRVTLRPIPDTMALLTAVLPVTQAVAVHAALARAAATAKANGDPRSTGQLMADTLVALVTGQEAATDIPIEVQVIITDRALLHGDDTPAHIPGYGPVPAAWLRHLLTPDDLEDMLDDLDHADTDDMDRVDTEQLTDDMDRANTEQLTDDVAHPHNLDPDGLDHDSHIDLDDLDHDSHTDLGDAKPTDVVDLAGARQGAPPRSERSDYASPVPPPAGPPLTEPLSSDRPPGPPPPVRAHPTAPPPRQSRRAQTWLRRLYTHPGTGTLITMDSRRRLFDAGLRRYLITRDGVCRTPWCDAPIRHLDHIRPHADGGPTTASNGQGLCVRCNLVKDQPGFNARVTHAGPTPSRHDEVSARDGEATARPHTVQLTTPTGHTYTSTAPPVLPCLDTPPQPEPRHAVTEPASASTSSEAVVIEIYPRAHSVIEYDATHLAS
ncbi:MAG TPA: HNH endonuclease, partial [Intrasporangium sp.]|nr:HNH endonuclease [Intrasporangium sp.]